MVKKQRIVSSAEAFEKALGQPQESRYILKLYIAGNTPRAQTAIINIRKVCEEHLQGRYQLEVVDITQKPELARSAQIVAAPTLIKILPLPLRRVIGDLSKTERILVGLDLIEAEK